MRDWLLNTTRATRTDEDSMNTASATRAGVHASFEALVHKMSKGATIKIPVASPSNHVTQTARKSDCGASPLQTRLVTPIVALITVPNKPARIVNLRTSCARANAREPFAYWLTR